MGNMSYCRFRNTLLDLRDVYRAWYELDEEERPSSEEIESRADILELCRKIVAREDGMGMCELSSCGKQATCMRDDGFEMCAEHFKEDSKPLEDEEDEDA